MKRPLLLILAIAVVGVAIYLISTNSNNGDETIVENTVTGYVSSTSASSRVLTIVPETGSETEIALDNSTRLLASNGEVVELREIESGDIIEISGIDIDEDDVVPSQVRVLSKIGPSELDENDSGKTFYYGLGEHFSVIVPSSYPDIVPSCTPTGVIEVAGGVLSVPAGQKTEAFEVIERGTCLVTSGEWNIAIQAVEVPSLETTTATTTQ